MVLGVAAVADRVRGLDHGVVVETDGAGDVAEGVTGLLVIGEFADLAALQIRDQRGVGHRSGEGGEKRERLAAGDAGVIGRALVAGEREIALRPFEIGQSPPWL